LVDLEGHGREKVVEDIDVSNTVGCFTTIYPVLLDIQQAEDVATSLIRTKERLRSVPGGGLGYGLLRYLRGDSQIEADLESLDHAEISFNYLGQLDRVLNNSNSSPFRVAEESCGPMRSERGLRSHLLSISGGVTNGQLEMSWVYSENIHSRNSIEKLANRYM